MKSDAISFCEEELFRRTLSKIPNVIKKFHEIQPTDDSHFKHNSLVILKVQLGHTARMTLTIGLSSI